MVQAAVRGWWVRSMLRRTKLSSQLDQSAALDESPADSCTSDDDEAELLALAGFAESGAASMPAAAWDSALGPVSLGVEEPGASIELAITGLHAHAHAHEEQCSASSGSSEGGCQIVDPVLESHHVSCTDEGSSTRNSRAAVFRESVMADMADMGAMRQSVTCKEKADSRVMFYEEIIVCWPSDDDSMFGDSDADVTKAASSSVTHISNEGGSFILPGLSSDEPVALPANSDPTASTIACAAESDSAQSEHKSRENCVSGDASHERTSSLDKVGYAEALSDKELRRRVGYRSSYLKTSLIPTVNDPDMPCTKVNTGQLYDE